MSGDDIKLAENLNFLLDQKQLSLHKLATQAKINKSSLHNYANGVVPQGLTTLLKISHYFETSLDELILGTQSVRTRKHQVTIPSVEKYEITIKKLHKN